MKLLRRFCSEQVQILLERMDDHWEEEFDIQESKWDPMLPSGNAFKQYTWVERRCISHTTKKQTAKLRRERAYTGILERTISPAKTRWEFNSEVRVDRQIIGEYGYAPPKHMLTTATLQSQMEEMLGQAYSQQIKSSMIQGIYK